MTDEELEKRFVFLIGIGRRNTLEILDVIAEVEKRQFYLGQSYSTLYEWLIIKHKFSYGSAYRRVQAVKLLADVPEVRAKMKTGSLNFTTISQLESAVKKEERRTKEKVSAQLKRELVKRIEDKSPEETARVLCEQFPRSAKLKDSMRVVDENHSTLVMTIEDDAVIALKRTRALLSHSCRTWSEVVIWLARDYLKRKDPLRK